jgi:hypothetical protein
MNSFNTHDTIQWHNHRFSILHLIYINIIPIPHCLHANTYFILEMHGTRHSSLRDFCVLHATPYLGATWRSGGECQMVLVPPPRPTTMGAKGPCIIYFLTLYLIYNLKMDIKLIVQLLFVLVSFLFVVFNISTVTVYTLHRVSKPCPRKGVRGCKYVLFQQWSKVFFFI